MQDGSVSMSSNKPHFAIIFTLLMIILWSLSLDERLKWAAAGIALFLFGMYFLEQGFKQAATPRLRRIIASSTDTLPKSIFLGFMLTLICQSSSLVLLCSISFLSVSLIPFSSALGMILGTNLGATGGAWLISSFGVKIDLAAYALPVLVPGVLLITIRQWHQQGLGFILSGLGFAFLGIDYLKDGFDALNSELFLTHLPQYGWRELAIFTGIGILVTVVVQSSHAALLISIAALASGQISYEGALAFTVGSNIGTSLTALLAAFNRGLEAKRLAFSHIMFNCFTAILFLVSFPITVVINDQIASWIGIASADLPMRLALYHTLFNLVGLVLLGSCIRYFRRFIVWCLPEPEKHDERIQAVYLNEQCRQDPKQACFALTKEVEHLYSQMLEIMAHGLVGVSKEQMLSCGEPEELTRNPYRATDSVQQMYRKRVKLLYGQILTFAANCKEKMTDTETEMVHRLISMARMIIEIIRMLRHLQGNFDSALEQGNRVQVQFHNNLHARLISLLRDMHDLQALQTSCTVREQMIKARQQISLETKQDRINIEALICQEKLDPMSAGSLMNDCQMVRTIKRTVLKMTSHRFDERQTIDLHHATYVDEPHQSAQAQEVSVKTFAK